ncbi:MAG: hypothetical protein RLP44_13305 [Aggregatilineales bacterium]
MNLKEFNRTTFGVTEAVIVMMAICGYILHETVTNPTSPLMVLLWVATLGTLVYITAYSVTKILDFVHDIWDQHHQV